MIKITKRKKNLELPLDSNEPSCASSCQFSSNSLHNWIKLTINYFIIQRNVYNKLRCACFIILLCLGLRLRLGLVLLGTYFEWGFFLLFFWVILITLLQVVVPFASNCVWPSLNKLWCKYIFLHYVKYFLFPIFVGSIIDPPSIVHHQLEILIIVDGSADKSIIINEFIFCDFSIVNSLKTFLI